MAREPKRLGTMVDISDGGIVQVDIDRTGDTMWVNVDGVCRFRAIRVDKLVVRDAIPLSKRKFKLSQPKCETHLLEDEQTGMAESNGSTGTSKSRYPRY